MADRPNILLITTDQQRFDTISALGNPHIYTPHLDWLVDEGITFTRAYADAPICMPSRATIMTGKHGYNSGLTGNFNSIVPMQDYPTLPGELTKAGYQTRAQGKMHFHPMRANYGFEHMELPMDYYRERHRRAHEGLPKQHGVGENEMEPVISTVHETESLTHWTVQRSIDFLETRDDTRPFFLWTSFTKPHPPFDPCANYWSLYANKDLPGPVRGEWSENVDEIPQGFMNSTYLLNHAYRMTDEQLKDSKRAYYACITQIDYELGLLFARMLELNLFDDTWVIFTTDHGEMLGDHHMGAKSVFLEGAAHIPLLIRPPANAWEDKPRAGQQVDTLVNLADIMPTILQMAGVSVPDCVDGLDLMSLTDGQRLERSFHGNCKDFFAIIEGDWKYAWTALGGGELLFNLADDPHEQHELIRTGKHKDIHKQLRSKLIEQMNEYDSDCVQDGELVHRDIVPGPHGAYRWPGFHSTVFPTDVLH